MLLVRLILVTAPWGRLTTFLALFSFRRAPCGCRSLLTRLAAGLAVGPTSLTPHGQPRPPDWRYLKHEGPRHFLLGAETKGQNELC